MEELGSQELEDILHELEAEYGPQERLPPETEDHLRVLQSDGPSMVRQQAAEELGNFGTRSARIVQALLTASESDPDPNVRKAATGSLRAPVHKDYLQQHPDLMSRAQKAMKTVMDEGVFQELPVLQRSRGDSRRRPKASTLDPAGPLAPTELVLLHGDRFARTSSAAVKLGEWVRLVHMDTDADARELGETMLAAAFLANEQAGAVHLEVRQQDTLFGLLKRDRLYVVPGEHAISWPRHSFESELCRISPRLQSKSRKGRNHVSEIIYDWWMRERRWESLHPWSTLGGLVFDGLVRRGLLRRERKPGLKGLLGSESLVLPAETAALAAQQSLEHVEQLLATCRRTRPKVWDLLIRGINKGIGKCKDDD